MKIRKDHEIIKQSSNLFIDILGKKIDIDKIQSRKLKVGFFVWARHKPKELFKNYIELNKCITDEKFNVIVDDNCSQIFMRIEQNEQKKLVEQYYEFFKNCNVITSSNVCKVSIQEFLELIKKIPYKSFYSFLPTKKKEKLKELDLGELAHVYLEIKTITYALTYCDVLFVGKRSSNIAYFYHHYIDKNANFIIVDDF